MSRKRRRPHKPSRRTLPELSSRLRGALAYRRFVAPPYTIALLDGRYHLHGECTRALTRLGHRVLPIAVDAASPANTVKALLYACIEQRVDMLLSINQMGFDEGGHLGTLLEQIELPVASWYVDSPHFVLRGAPLPAAAVSTVFVWERSFVASLRALGLQDVHYLPLATDPEVFRPLGYGESRALCFVGDSMKRACAKWQARLGHNARRQAGDVAAALLADRQRDPFEVVGTERDERHACDIVAAGTWRATRDYRAGLLRAIDSPALCVHGDEGWGEQLSQARLCGPVNYGAPLAALYESSAININATSLQMQSAVNQRVFDAPASGGFVLSDAQSDLLELFEPGREIAVYRDADELAAQVERFLHDEEARRMITARARARVLAEHRYEHRLQRVLDVVSARHASPAVRRTSCEPSGASPCL